MKLNSYQVVIMVLGQQIYIWYITKLMKQKHQIHRIDQISRQMLI